MPFPTTHTNTHNRLGTRKKNKNGEQNGEKRSRVMASSFTIIFGGIIFDYNGASAFTIMLDRKRKRVGKQRKICFCHKPSQMCNYTIYKYIYSMYFNAASFIEMATLIHISFHYSLLLLPQYILFCSVFSHDKRE